MTSRTWLASLVLLVGCAPSEPLGPPVTPSAFCPQLARVICDADDDCCAATSEDPDCVDTETVACAETLGQLLEDPRVLYVPERAGAYLERLRADAAECFATPTADVRLAFEGTLELGESCTPPSVDDVPTTRDLFVAAAACGEDACRAHLDLGGHLDARCERREAAGTDACSHPFDCATGEYCNLAEAWRAGDWGRCQPTQGEGWACTRDAECASAFCDAGRCTTRTGLAQCLVVAYPDLVLSTDPVLFLRLGERSGRSANDASPNATHGSYAEPVERVEGALSGSDDRAISLSGMGGSVSVAEIEALSTEEVTLELFVSIPEMGGGPIAMLLGEDGELLRLDADGRTLRASVPGMPGEGMMEGAPLALASADGALTEGFHHVALVVSGRDARLYLDGAEVSTVAGAGALPARAALRLGLEPNEDPMMTRSLTGSLDEVALYRAALDPSVLAAHVAAARDGETRRDSFVYAWAR